MCGEINNANRSSEEYAVSFLGKVKFSLKRYSMKTYGGADVWTHVFLNLALYGGKWSASRPGRSSVKAINITEKPSGLFVTEKVISPVM
jgi:hypothetical protein